MNVAVARIKGFLITQPVFVFWALSFILPLFLNSSQIITGTIVNCLLFLGAARLTKKEIIPLVIFPSLGAASHGVLFGPQTIFLYYFLPFIWAGNYILVWVFQKTYFLPGVVRVIVSATSKFAALQLFAWLYFRAHIVPQIFVSAMGYVQLTTAIIGGLLAFAAVKKLWTR